MLDVHPPEHTPHSWRDFFIHIATIVVGLLIAVGLEQTVEWMHHLHQRHQLEHDLHEEAEKNLAFFKQDRDFYLRNRASLIAVRRYADALRSAHLEHKPLPPWSVPPPGSPIFGFPTTTAWQSAKESSLVGLLPREQATMFNDLYFENARLSTYAEKYFDLWNAIRRFEAHFKDASETSYTYGSRKAIDDMSPEELRQYSALAADTLDSLENIRYLTSVNTAATEAVIRGVQSSDELERYIGEAGMQAEMPAEH